MSACLTHHVPVPNRLLVMVRLSRTRAVVFFFDNRRPMSAFRDSCEAACRSARTQRDSANVFGHMSLFMRCPDKHVAGSSAVLLPILFNEDREGARHAVTIEQKLQAMGKMMCGLNTQSAYGSISEELATSPICVDEVDRMYRGAMSHVQKLNREPKFVQRMLAGIKSLTHLAQSNQHSRKACFHNAHCNCFMRSAVQSAKAGWLLLYAVPRPTINVVPPGTTMHWISAYQQFVVALSTHSVWITPASESSDQSSLDSSSSFSTEPTISGTDGVVVLATYHATRDRTAFEETLRKLIPSLHICYAQPLRLLLQRVRRKRFEERIIRHSRRMRDQVGDALLYTLLTSHKSRTQRLYHALEQLRILPVLTLHDSKQLGYDIAVLVAYMQIIDDLHISPAAAHNTVQSPRNTWLELTKIDPFHDLLSAIRVSKYVNL